MTAGSRKSSLSSSSSESCNGHHVSNSIDKHQILIPSHVNVNTCISKKNKPLMEKRRRARINKSLSELENLIIVPNEELKNGSSKLEKADILEITVKYLREMCQVQKSQHSNWSDGFNECVKWVESFLEKIGQSHLSQKLTSHLGLVYTTKLNSEISLTRPDVSLPSTSSTSAAGETGLDCSTSERTSTSIHEDHQREPINLAKYRHESDTMWRPWSYCPIMYSQNFQAFNHEIRR